MRLCVIARTYTRQHRGFTALLASLLAAHEGCSKFVKISVDVFPTDATAELGEQTRTQVAALIEQPAFRSLGVSLRTHQQLNISELTNLWTTACGHRPLQYDFGYLQSDAVLRKVLARKGAEGEDVCNYILVTNGDNLYADALLDFTCPHMRSATGIIGYYFSSHNAGVGTWGKQALSQGRIERTGSNVLFKTRLRKGWCDLGAVMIRADLLRGMPNGRIFTDCGAWREADGRMIERLVRVPNISTVVLDRILFFHQ